jgi:hypothetical protein
MLKEAWVPETFRHMRHSWKLLHDYLVGNNYSPDDFISPSKGHIRTDFEAATAKLYTRNAWLPLCSHVTTLYDIFQPDANKRTELLRRVVKRRTPGKQKKYKTMWDIGKLLRFIAATYPNNEALTLIDLLTKMVVLVMVFSVRRFPELTRLSVDPLRIATDRPTALTVMKTALDEQTPITLRPLEDASICPVGVVREWLSKTGEKGSPLFVDPISRRPLTARKIGGIVREVFDRAEIPPIYGSYTIKHSVVSFLFDCGIEEWRINEFGRWAAGSHTAASHYKVA